MQDRSATGACKTPLARSTTPRLHTTHLLQVVQGTGQAEGSAVEEAAARLKGEQEARGAHQLAAPGRQRACGKERTGARRILVEHRRKWTRRLAAFDTSGMPCCSRSALLCPTLPQPREAASTHQPTGCSPPQMDSTSFSCWFSLGPSLLLRKASRGRQPGGGAPPARTRPARPSSQAARWGDKRLTASVMRSTLSASNAS